MMREVGTRPWRRISCEKVMRKLARRCMGGSATKVPRPGIAPHQALLGQLRHGVARGHAADPELGAEVGVGGQPLARSERGDARRAATISISR